MRDQTRRWQVGQAAELNGENGFVFRASPTSPRSFHVLALVADPSHVLHHSQAPGRCGQSRLRVASGNGSRVRSAPHVAETR